MSSELIDEYFEALERLKIIHLYEYQKAVKLTMIMYLLKLVEKRELLKNHDLSLMSL